MEDHIDDNAFSENLFQIGLPVAEALVPLNPYRMPGHMLATAFSDGMRFGDESLLRPFENFQSMLEYLATSQSDAQYNSRFGQVCHDLAIVNTLAETCGAPGEIIAGDYANQASDEYMQQICEDERYPDEDDLIAKSLRLKLRGGPGSKSTGNFSTTPNLPDRGGIGLFKQRLTPGTGTNPFKELPYCRRTNDRPIWTYKFFSDGRINFITPRLFYSVKLIEIINSYTRCYRINLILKPVKYIFYVVSIYYVILYLKSEVRSVRNYFIQERNINKLCDKYCSLFHENWRIKNKSGRNSLF